MGPYGFLNVAMNLFALAPFKRELVRSRKVSANGQDGVANEAKKVLLLLTSPPSHGIEAFTIMESVSRTGHCMPYGRVH